MAASRAIALVRSLVRHSPWTVIAVTLHVIAFAVLSVVTLTRGGEEPLTGLVQVVARAPDKPVHEPLPVEEPPERKPIPPKEEHELLPFEIFPDDVLPIEPDLSQDVGDPDASLDLPPSLSIDAGSTIGVGPGKEHRGQSPSPLGPRGDPNQIPGKGVPPSTPSEATEEAILFGFRWLLSHQAPDGSWSAANLRERCVGEGCLSDGESFDAHYDPGLTALALLAFLGKGYAHDAKARVRDTLRERYFVIGPAVRDGLKWLVERQNEDGSFSAGKPFLYNEALCTLALCEAYALTRNRYWREPAERAVGFLVRAQKLAPVGQAPWGWRYGPRPDVTITSPLDPKNPEHLELIDADTSVTGWVLMALKSAELAELEVPRSALEGGLAFMRWVSRPDGQAGYLDQSGAGMKLSGQNQHFDYHPAVMGALSMCARAFVEHDLDDPFLEPAARRLVADLPAIGRDRLAIDYYYWYYGSLALNQFDGPDSPRRSGKYWNPWAEAMVESVLALQDRPHPKACNHGAWRASDRWSYAGGPVYATALNVLTLEVYYRYENAFGSAARARAKR